MQTVASYPPYAVTAFFLDESGGSFLEYALLGSLVLVFCLLGFLAIGKYA
jgi:hypothetical protein